MGRTLRGGNPSRLSRHEGLLCVKGPGFTGKEPTVQEPGEAELTRRLSDPLSPLTMGWASCNPTKSCRSSGSNVIARDEDTGHTG